MHEFINTLASEFTSNSHADIAQGQKAYMRNQFAFFGIKTPLRRALQKPFLTKEMLPPKKQLEKIMKILWDKPQRDFQLFGLDFIEKYSHEFTRSDMPLLEYMVTHKSWWDTVDFIATKLMGAYFAKYPDERLAYSQKWLNTNNIWLQRSALLFQLKYKKKLDTQLLTHTIQSLLGSNEFFINKAIGWILREYSKTDPQWVIRFVKHNPLHNLSRREALKLVERKIG